MVVILISRPGIINIRSDPLLLKWSLTCVGRDKANSGGLVLGSESSPQIGLRVSLSKHRGRYRAALQ